MNARTFWPMMLGAALLLGAASDLPAQGNNKNQADERKEDERVRAAKKAVDDAQNHMKDAQRELQESTARLHKAEAAHKAAIDKAQAARRQAEDEHEAKLGMPALQKQQADAQSAYDAAAAPVVQKLKATGPYQAAVNEATAAKQELQTLKQAQPVGGGDRNPRESELIRTTLKPAELEKAALAADPAAQAARQRLTGVQANVAAARDKVKSAVEGDSRLRGALKALDASNADLAKAKTEFARDRDKVPAALAKVNREKAQLASATAADRRDDNKPNNNKPNNNKKPNNKNDKKK